MRGTAPSLGDMLKRAGLVDASTYDTLVVTLRERLRSGKPTSLGRLLIERGIASTRILAVATSGERQGTVRCDACSLAQPVPSSAAAREFPCGRCGAYLLPLGPATDGSGGSTIIDGAVIPIPAKPPFTPALDNPPPNDDTTMPIGTSSPLAGLRNTNRFESILPIPGEPEEGGGTTLAFNKVLPIPPGKAAGAPPAPLAPVSFAEASEDPTISLPGPSSSQPMGGGPIGIPPQIHARPVYGSPPFVPQTAAGVPPMLGVPPVIQDARVSSSGLRRQQAPPPEIGMDSEAPTVADAEGSAGAFGPAAAAALAAPPGTRSTAAEERSPLAGSRDLRTRSGRQDRRRPGTSKGLIVFLAFAATLFVAAMAMLVFAVFKHLH